MANNIHLLSYLRKGLGNYINNGQTTKDRRATIDLTVKMEGTEVSGKTSTIDGGLSNKLSLVGPADIKQVNPSIISQIYPPAINAQHFNSLFMPFMEFYEADFPWRYTPLPATENGNCTPWLVLVAVTEDEYKWETKEGKKKVVFNLTGNRYKKEVFPTAEIHDKLAHVQLEKEGDKEGISRLLCGSKLPAGERITVFLLPAFEIGRLSGLGEKYEDVNIDKLSWEDEAKEFPVYYHWSYNTIERPVTFETLANKLDMQPTNAYNDLKANLTVDIAESGLANDGLQSYRDRKEECVIDVPAALIPTLGKNPTLRTENDYYPNNSETYKDILKKELSLTPVFVENAKGTPPLDEDPWVVPPVYGARHLLSENLDKDDVVAEVNLNLRHRIAAGMGSSVVKENQEYFVHRAWQKVEKINELNQELREYYQMQEVEKKAEKRLAKEAARIKRLWNTQLSKRHIRLLTSDTLPRTLNATKLTRKRISTGNVRDVVSNDNWKPDDDGKRIIGITPEELRELFDPQTWNTIITDKDFLKTMDKTTADHVIEQYKKEHNWMQYLLMPYYNEATDSNNRSICAKKPLDYPTGHDCLEDFFMISKECNDLFFWMWGWDEEFIPDDAHTFNYYYDAAKNGFFSSNRNIFHANYNANDLSSISSAVYPLTLEVIIEKNNKKSYYDGYIMDASCFKEFCNKMNFGNIPYIAFEYNETSGLSVKENNKRWKFLFPSDYDGLIYREKFHICNKGEHYYHYTDFKYSKDDGFTSHNEGQNGSLGKFEYIDNTLQPYTKTNFFNETIQTMKIWLAPNYNKDWVKTDSAHPNMGYLSIIQNNNKIRRIYIQEDGLENDVETQAKYYSMINEFEMNVELLDTIWLSSPDSAYLKLPNFNEHNENIKRVSDFGLTMTENEMLTYYKEIHRSLSLIDHNSRFGLEKLPEVKEEPEPQTPNLEEEKQDTIKALIQKYGYTEDAQLDEIKNRGLTKYPVMIYPDFLDPTYFYLRELSENYIIPSAGELTNNSVTVFQNNTKFEEAFLMGMNTEMGQELLWREYPTDQRGSYFRKFWKAAQPPEKTENYYDIKEVHQWNKPLGGNHIKDNAQMLVFAIKGELMQAYPKTTIYLSKYDKKTKTISVVEQASITAWLTEDTYLVGFEGVDMQQAKNLCLTFQEDVTGLEFENREFESYAASSKDSAELAWNLLNKQSVFLLPINN